MLWLNDIIYTSKEGFYRKKVTCIIIFIIRIFPNFDFVILVLFS